MAFLRKYVTPLLLILFCWYYSGINFSSHAHIVDGKRVVHSHPGANEGHSHSSSQVSAIDFLCHFQSYEPLAFDPIEKNVLLLQKCILPSSYECLADGYSSVCSLRGPPSLFFS